LTAAELVAGSGGLMKCRDGSPALRHPGTSTLRFLNNTMGSLKKRRKAKINKHKRRKKLRANRHKKRTWQK
jgi:hypothetical protein